MSHPLFASGRRSRREGLTLIEIALAVSIMALLVAGLFAAMDTSLKAESFTRERQVASEEAARQLDLYLATPNYAFSNLVSTFDVKKKTGNSTTTDTSEVTLKPAFVSPINADRPSAEQSRVGRVDVTVGAGGRSADFAEVRVTVRWHSVDGQDVQLYMIGGQARED